MSKKTTKQSTFQSFYRSRYFIPMTIGLLICVALVGIIIGSITVDRNPIMSARNSLAIPTSWKLENEEKHSGSECVLADVTCPSQSATYDISGGSNSLATDLEKVGDVLSQKGFKQTKSCYEFSDNCKVLGVDANNGKVSVAVWVVNDSNPLKAYVEIQEVH